MTATFSDLLWVFGQWDRLRVVALGQKDGLWVAFGQSDIGSGWQLAKVMDSMYHLASGMGSGLHKLVFHMSQFHSHAASCLL